MRESLTASRLASRVFFIFYVAFLLFRHYAFNMPYEIPYQYTLCQNSSCPQASECIRACAYSELTAETKSVYVLNPQCYPEQGRNCNYFRSIQKVTVAWGIKNFYQNMLYPTAKKIKWELMCYFGKSRYYRFYREELPIKPKEQKAIKQIFLENGVTTEPPYTRFTQEFDWTY